MIFLKLLLFCFSFLFVARGSDQHLDPAIINILEEMNEGRPKNIYSDLRCNLDGLPEGDVVTNKVNDARNMNDCAIALCGLPTENTSVYLTNSNFSQYITKNFKRQMDELTPQLKLAFDKVQKIKLSMISDLEKYILENGSVMAKPENWSGKFKEDLSKTIFEPYLDIIVNLQKPIAERLQIKIVIPNDASDDFKNQLEIYAKDYEFFLRNNSEQVMKKALYSKFELKSIASDKLEKMKKVFTQNLVFFDEFSQKDFNNESKTIESNLSHLITENDYLYLFLRLRDMETKVSRYIAAYAKMIKPPSCSDELKCGKIYQNYLNKQNFADQIKNFKNNLLDPKVRERSENSCKAEIIARASTSADEKIAKKLVSEVKAQIELNVFSKFSEDSKGKLKDYFANKIKNSPVKSLTLITAGNAPFLEKLKNYFSPDSNDPAFMEIGAMFKRYSNQKYSELPMTQEEALVKFFEIAQDLNNYDPYSMCTENTKRTNAWDEYISYKQMMEAPDRRVYATLSPMDHLFISDFTCHHDLHGKSATAHELGHAISQIFLNTKLSESSTKFYESLRQCVTDNYVNFVAADQGGRPNDGIQTEEDTADLIGFMTYPSPKNLFLCAIIQPSFNEKSYNNLSFLVEKGDEDYRNTHSRPLYRLVMETINKGVTLPISCQKAIEPMKNRLRFRKCIP